jgi:3-hydroxybutyryl-CoA dehydrogenase
MNTICVCGAGTMGSGIAQVAASAGFRTILYDLNGEIVETARTGMEKNLHLLVEKQKISLEKKEEMLSLLLFTSDISQCVADLVIEAVIEKAEVKVGLFNRLAAINSDQAIFATNTSSLSVSAIAREVKHPSRVAGLHFFNPAPLMKLVEVVRGEQTSDGVTAALVSLTRRCGKTPVVCRDSPGFIVNRVARPFYIESLRMLEEGLLDVETIDRVLESRGFRMGPFRLMDLIGNDINYAVSNSVYEQLSRPERLKPSHIQQEKVERGELGKKTGKGYYLYGKP